MLIVISEAVRMLSGSVRWCLDLMSWLIDSLLHPEDSSVFDPISTGQKVELGDLNTRLQASNNVALHLLLSSASRGFLTAICRRLSHLDYTARKAMQSAAQSQSVQPGQLPQPLISNFLRASYTAIATLTSGSIIQIRVFETFLTSISASVKDAYTAAGLSSSPSQAQSQHLPQTKPTEVTRNTAEQTMLFGGPLPAALVPAMTHLFTSLLPTLRSGIDPSKLFFHDYSLLALDPFPPCARQSPLGNSWTTAWDQGEDRGGVAEYKVSHTIDVFQRIPVVLGMEPDELGFEKLREVKRWRRCARCAAVMEDLFSPKPAVQFLIMQQRRCFCGGNWVILTGHQVVA